MDDQKSELSNFCGNYCDYFQFLDFKYRLEVKKFQNWRSSHILEVDLKSSDSNFFRKMNHGFFTPCSR
ncbi:hypothetical protein LEP1GSC081_3028 [Leptospira kirschneri str. H1]|uniref:Uncharacterized protein n=1 Tax=Leptospira kirschneri str. H1 TaxID=1049966 RepID=A0A0E2AZ43_9LEPT|nr:hypothetical protein LEP1GSC081_3028 [Leptospira kirschneri str. H1]